MPLLQLVSAANRMLPSAPMSRLLVGAPGRIRNGSRLPLVWSRTKKLASLAPMSQVWAVNPPPVCSRRMAGVSVLRMCIASAAASVPIPTLPLVFTRSAFSGAPASTRNTCRPAVASSMAK